MRPSSRAGGGAREEDRHGRGLITSSPAQSHLSFTFSFDPTHLGRYRRGLFVEITGAPQGILLASFIRSSLFMSITGRRDTYI